MMIRGNQLYLGRTRLNPWILDHPLMALRPVMPLRTIVDQILMERRKARQPIVQATWACDCIVASYWWDEGYCGEPAKAFQSRRLLRIYYDWGLSNTKWYAALMRHAYDESKAVVREGYQVSGDSFNPSESTSSNI